MNGQTSLMDNPEPSPPGPSSKGWWLMLVAEILMVLVILGLLAAIWLPAFMGTRAGSSR